MSSPKSPAIAPRFSLRALLIFMLLAGPLCGWGWSRYQAWQEWKIQQEALRLREKEYAVRVADLQQQAKWLQLIDEIESQSAHRERVEGAFDNNLTINVD